MSWTRALLPALLLVCVGARDAGPGSYVAYSLREVERRLAAGGSADDEIRRLGGMTRILAVVQDREGDDVILVGRRVPGLPPAHLDDLAAAMRAALVHHECPLVSIDPTPESATTGELRVRFGGGIAGTRFGADFLECDVILKRYGLEKTDLVPRVPAFKALCLESLAARIRASGDRVTGVRDVEPEAVSSYRGRGISSCEARQARFWFYPVEPYAIVFRDDVTCIRELRLCVKAEILGTDDAAAGGPGDGRSQEEALTFAREFTASFPAVVDRHPKLARLKVLFDLTAVAERMTALDAERRFPHLLHGHRMATMETPRTHPLLHSGSLIETASGSVALLDVAGGIDFGTEIRWLNYGAVSRLRDVVVRSRPSQNTVVWRLPLEAWTMPNAQDLDADWRTPREIEPRPGCSLAVQTAVLQPVGGAGPAFTGFPAAIAPAGLPARLPVAGVEIAPEPAGDPEDLEGLKESILKKKRPGGG